MGSLSATELDSFDSGPTPMSMDLVMTPSSPSVVLSELTVKAEDPRETDSAEESSSRKKGK